MIQFSVLFYLSRLSTILACSRIDVYRRLLPLCKKSDVEKQAHIERIVQMKTPKISAPKPTLAVQAPEPAPKPPLAAQAPESALRTDLCPRCGKQLVPRKGKIGPFIGCSRYPNCRFTKN